MKVQKLGIQAGVGLAVLCAALQGCKEAKNPVQASINTPDPTVIAPDPATTPDTADISIIEAIPPEPAPAVKRLPPPPAPVRIAPAAPARPAPAPAIAPAGTTYVVKKNETLGGIAYRHHSNIKTLLAANPGIKDPNRIRIGQKIVIPEAAALPPAPTSAPAPAVKPVAPAKITPPATTGGEAAGEYVVRKNDNLSTIAAKHKTTSKKIMALNGLKSDRIRPGMKLKIPGASAPKKDAAKPAAKTAKKDAPVAKKPADGTAEAKKDEPAKPAVEDAKPTVEEAKPKAGAAPAAESADAPAYKEYTPLPEEDVYAVAIKFSVGANTIRELNNLKGDKFAPGATIKLPPDATHVQ